jgi:hypothetical protein
MGKSVDRILVSQPIEWIEAFKIQAKRNGESLSEFLGDCAKVNLDKDLRMAINDERPKRGPKSAVK